MSRIRVLHPGLVHVDLQDFLSHPAVRVNIFHVIPRLDAFYKTHLPMHKVLGHFKVPIDDPSFSQSVACRFPEHGSPDSHHSAKYFPQDARTGDEIGAVYCFKCGLSRTSLWYFHALANTETFSETLVMVHSVFSFLPSFPRDYFLDFDHASYFDLSKDSRLSNLHVAPVMNFRDACHEDSIEARQYLYTIISGEGVLQ